MLAIFRCCFESRSDGAPRGATNFFEAILEFLRVEVFRPALKEHTDRFVPFLWTLFFFILFCNLLGQIRSRRSSRFPARQAFALGWYCDRHNRHDRRTGDLHFHFIHFSGIIQVARSLINGTYGHHGHHEEHSSDGEHGHEAAHDLEHARGEGLAADVPGDIDAIGNPGKHYADDEHVGHHHAAEDHGDLHGHAEHGKGMNPAAAALLAVPLYFWNFAPHPFKPGPGGNPIMYVLDTFMWAFLLALEIIGALIKPLH